MSSDVWTRQKAQLDGIRHNSPQDPFSNRFESSFGRTVRVLYLRSGRHNIQSRPGHARGLPLLFV